MGDQKSVKEAEVVCLMTRDFNVERFALSLNI
jgi:hypothetical protein